MKSIGRIAVLIAIASVGFFSCTKDVTAPVQISGKWVESKDRLDTLVFGYDNLLELKRGNQLRRLFSYSSTGSGLYKYTLKADSIGLNYLVSSTYVINNYAFKMEANSLYIGDFYQKRPGTVSTLIFERMK